MIRYDPFIACVINSAIPNVPSFWANSGNGFQQGVLSEKQVPVA
jgi:hypothetical protein